MKNDRYLKVILTVLAVELLWLGLKEGAPGVSAQAQPARVVIAGIQLDPADHDYLPVAVAGSLVEIPERQRASLAPLDVRVLGTVAVEASVPLRIEVDQPLRIEADRPLKIEADRPLPVEAVPYTPGLRPGD